MKAKEQHALEGNCPMFEFLWSENFWWVNYAPEGTTYECTCCLDAENSLKLADYYDEDIDDYNDTSVLYLYPWNLYLTPG